MSHQHEVIVIGAGPVGLLLAGLLGRQGLRVLVLERALERPSHSQAIGITPPSLEILGILGLAESLVRQGIPIRECHVHGMTGYLGRANFREVGGPFPFILSLPQQVTMRALEEHLAAYPNVQLRRGVEVTGLRQEAKHVAVATTGDSFTAAYAVACDGCHSRVREFLGIKAIKHHYGCHFLMADFLDNTELGQEAHLFFMPQGAVESFPMPEGKRRWIVQTDARLNEAALGVISGLVRERTGLNLAAEAQLNQSAFSPWRLDCARLDHGRVLLCGDAAHVMSPIGGQGMNTGFADAEFAAAMLDGILRRGQAAAPWLRMYDHCRGIAARTAAARAARGMWLGTWRGSPASLLRDFILRHCLFRGLLAPHLGRWFAMLSLPYNRLEKSAWAVQQLQS